MFNLSDFIKNPSSLPKTKEGIQEAATAILGNEDLQKLGGSTAKALKSWARRAEGALSELSRIEGSADDANAKARSGLSEKDQDAYASMMKKYSSLLQDKSEEGRAEAAAQSKKMKDFIQTNAVTESQRLLDNAHGWMSGAEQPTKARKLQKDYKDAIQEAKSKYSNALENLANATAGFPKDQSQWTAKQKETAAKWQTRADDLYNKYTPILAAYGAPALDKSQVLSQDAAGNFTGTGVEQPEGAVPGGPAATGARGRLGEAVVARQDADGTYSIVGTDTDKVFQSGIATPSEANALMTQLQAGSTPSVAGRPDLYAIAPTLPEEQAAVAAGTARVATPEELAQVTAGTLPTAAAEQAASGATETGYTSSILPEGYDLSGFTEEQKKALEATYLGAGDSTDLMNKALSSVTQIEITDEDMQKFYDESKEFYTGKGSYYAQAFSRGAEDFQRSVEFATAQREDQMKQEALQKQLALEQEQVGMAEAGLATSGIRQKAEQRLAEQARDVATSSRRAFEYDVTKAGRGAEDILGSSTIAGLTLPKLGGTSVYAPAGDIKGSLEREQESAILDKQQALAAQMSEARLENLALEGGVSLS